MISFLVQALALRSTTFSDYRRDEYSKLYASVSTKYDRVPHEWWVAPHQKLNVLDDENSPYQRPADYPILSLGESFLAVHRNGGASWGGRIPKELDDQLRGRQNTLPNVNLLALGPDERYFVQFDDGTSSWSFSKKEDYLSGFVMGSSKVTSIAIGPNGSYFCKNDMGRIVYENLPKGLFDSLKGRKKSLSGPENVNLGPKGEWFVRFTDGSFSYGRTTNRCDEIIQELKGSRRLIHEIIFGQDHCWVIRYF